MFRLAIRKREDVNILGKGAAGASLTLSRIKRVRTVCSSVQEKIKQELKE